MAKKTQAKTRRRANKFLWLTGAVVILVAILAVLVYAMVSPGPEERMAKGFAKLLSADTVSVEVTSSTQTGQVEVISEIKAVTNKKVVDASYVNRVGREGQDPAEIKADVVILETGDMYAKVNDPQRAVEATMNAMMSSQLAQSGAAADQSEGMAETMRSFVKSYSESIANKIGDRWVRVPKQDLSLNGVGSEVQMGCYVDFVRTAHADKKAREELVKIFTDNNFLKVEEKLESKGTSAGYALSIEQGVRDKFIEQAKDNAAFQQVLDCDPSLALLTGATEGQIAVWVDRVSNSITHVKVSGSDDGVDGTSTTEVKFGYSGRVNPAEPTESIDMKELVEGLNVGAEAAPSEEPTPVTE